MCQTIHSDWIFVIFEIFEFLKIFYLKLLFKKLKEKLEILKVFE